MRVTPQHRRLARFSAWSGLVLALLGCDSNAQRESETRRLTADVQARLQALVKKSTQRLSFVPGGGFWLGDPGVLMTDELKKSGKVLGPDAKITGNPGYTLGEDNKTPRWVTLDSFSIQQLKVTYDDFDVYVAANGLPQHPPEGDEPLQRIWRAARTSGDVPVGVNWFQAKAYCQWLGKTSGLPFDLPTEAQWEFAASNGRKTHFEPIPTNTGILEQGRNHPDFDAIKAMLGTRGSVYPVGRYPPSKLGLHDLVGNGLEWVNDWYAADAYSAMANTRNPSGPEAGTERVLRGKPADEDLAFAGFAHTLRFHQPPSDKVSEVSGKPFPYISESIRCVVNKPEPVAGSRIDGPSPVTNPMLDRTGR